eukprot:403359436
MQEQKIQDQLLGFRSQLDPSRQKALIQKLMSDQTDMATQRLAQAILESFSKSEVLDSERERAQKIAQEISPQGNTSEDKKDFTNKKMLNEEKKVERQPFKPKSVVAIDERELNKVELAYFKRPLDVVILSDKYVNPVAQSFYRDASRLLKGQDVPHLHGQKRILQTYGVQLNGAITSYNYDGDSGQENETKAQNAKNQALEYDAEVASNMSQSESEPPYNGNGPHATPLNSIRKSTNNHHGPSTFQRRGGIGQNIKGLSNKIKTNKGRVLPMRRSHNMSEAGSQDDERSVKDGDSDSFSEMNKKLYCICQQEYKHGNLMFQCEGPCEGWYHPQCVKMPEERVQHLKNSNDPWICDFCLNYANGQADLNNQISSGKLTACELVDSASKHKKKRDIKAASKTLGGQLNLSQGNSKESSKDIGPSSSVQGNNNGQISNNQSQ